jgi:hypothetical protein
LYTRFFRGRFGFELDEVGNLQPRFECDSASLLGRGPPGVLSPDRLCRHLIGMTAFSELSPALHTKGEPKKTPLQLAVGQQRLRAFPFWSEYLRKKRLPFGYMDWTQQAFGRKSIAVDDPAMDLWLSRSRLSLLCAAARRSVLAKQASTKASNSLVVAHDPRLFSPRLTPHKGR